MRGPAAIAAATLALAIPGWTAAGPPCPPDDKKCLFEAALAHPARTRSAWATALKLPVERRLGPAPLGLVEYLALDNAVHGFSERPRAATLSGDFLRDVQGAMDELPAPVKRALNDDFVGLYFVEDLGGTGYTDYVMDGERIAGAFIVLDAGILSRRRANEWATWKEQSPFVPSPSHSLEARIAPADRDDRRGAIQYILLHELGHVLSASARVHPPWNIQIADARPEDYPFSRLSWRVDREQARYVSLFDARFPLRPDVVYYLGARLPASDMPRAYSQLEATNFPTLYAATSPGDDFAESFANYVHVVLLKKPFEILLTAPGRPVKSYRACWEEARCAPKRRLLEGLLAP